MTTPLAAVNSVAAVEQRIRELRVVAILRLDAVGLSASQAATRALRICEALAGSGIRAVEVTTNRAHALESIAAVAERLGDEVLLGAGTVLDEASVDAVANAGARFCVSPHLRLDVVAASRRRGLLPIPGVLSPTEVVAAAALGIDLVKLFPAGPLGTAYLTALRAPFGEVGFMPTGGIDIGDAARWLAAGAVALGVGSSLVSADGSLEGLAERGRLLADVAAEAGRAGGGGS